MTRTRTIIVDDHRGFRKTLSKALSRYPFIEVVAEAENGEEALDKVGVFSPDLVTVDINLPGMNGFELAEILKEQTPGTRVIFIAFNGNPVFERKAKELDCPYVPKETLLEDLDETLWSVRRVIEGERRG